MQSNSPGTSSPQRSVVPRLRFSRPQAELWLGRIEALFWALVMMLPAWLAGDADEHGLGLFIWGAAGLALIILAIRIPHDIASVLRHEPVPALVIDAVGVTAIDLFSRRHAVWAEIAPLRLVKITDQDVNDRPRYGLVAFGHSETIPDTAKAQWQLARFRLQLPGQQRDDGVTDAKFCDWLNDWRAAMLRHESPPSLPDLREILERLRVETLS
jgi:hypothetical protein